MCMNTDQAHIVTPQENSSLPITRNRVLNSRNRSVSPRVRLLWTHTLLHWHIHWPDANRNPPVDGSVPITRNRIFTSFRPRSRCYELAFEFDSCLSDASRGFLRNGAQILLNGLTQEKGLIWLLWKHRNGSQIRQRRFGFRVSVSFRTRSQFAHLLHYTPTEFLFQCSERFHKNVANFMMRSKIVPSITFSNFFLLGILCINDRTTSFSVTRIEKNG